jgi:hypothetical protein
MDEMNGVDPFLEFGPHRDTGGCDIGSQLPH